MGRRVRGFTLVEVLIALALMAIAMLAIVPLFANSMKSNAVGQDFASLNALAKERLEEILQYNFTDARLTVPTGAEVTLDVAGTPTLVAGQLYRNMHPLTQTDGTVSLSYPYELVYVVQDYNLDAFGRPDFTTAVDDSDASWTAKTGVKLITVFAASSRESLSGTTYNLGSNTTDPTKLLLSSGSTGKQIRISAVKSP
ncbi:MAG TPA: type II secretion system protein [Thermoanaerobaculia bacterium]|nr:type II secretion system protein [Thermoanaerobaculia bacterium]